MWAHRGQKTQTLCDACAWLRPLADFEQFDKVTIHWLAEEVRAVALTKCVQCRGRHLEWSLPNNCTGCIRAILDKEPRHLPAFPIIEAPRLLEPSKPRDVHWNAPAGAE